MHWWQIDHKGFRIILPSILICELQCNWNCLGPGAKYVGIFNERNESAISQNRQTLSGRIILSISSSFLFYSRQHIWRSTSYVICDNFCVTHIQLLNQLTYFQEIWSECYAIPYHTIPLLYIYKNQ